MRLDHKLQDVKRFLESSDSHTPEVRWSIAKSHFEDLLDMLDYIPMSPLEKKVFKWIDAYTEENGMAPSFMEIATGLDIYDSQVSGVVKNLERKGHLRRSRDARSIVLLHRGPENQDS